MIEHWSDCATNNGPDGPVGRCDCEMNTEPGHMKNLQPNTAVRHIASGHTYVVQSNAQCKINGDWKPVVIYRPVDRNEVFVRETEEFCAEFEPASGGGR